MARIAGSVSSAHLANHAMIRTCVMLALAVTASACDRSPQSGYGFTLPTGDAAAGEEHFVALQCTACHTIAGRSDITHQGARARAVALGGPTPRIATYGELVTSIINPSHRVAQDEGSNASDADAASPMTNYNAVMTVQQLIDLTQFLQDQYKIRQPDPTEYPEYFYP